MTDHQNHPDATRNLQRYLRQLSFWEKSIPAPPVDGIFESRTVEALREYQRLRNLAITGIANRETWDRLYEDYRISLSQNSPPAPILIFPPEPDAYILTPNSIGFAVSALQYMLRELGQHHKELEDLQITGIYDPPTVDAVKLFQERNQLIADGNTDHLTWNALASQYNTLFDRAQQE